MTADAGFISQYLRTICNLETACIDIYEPVKQKYVNICKEIYKAFTEVLDIVKTLEDKNLVEINKYTNSVLKNYIKKSTEKIQDLPSSCLQKSDNTIRDSLFNETIDHYKNTVELMYKRYKIGGDLHLNSTARFYYDEIGNLKGTAMIEQYDHTKVGYAHFIDALKNLNTSLIDVVVEYKKSLLFGKYMDEHNDRTILLCNPIIDFVKSDLVNIRMLCNRAFMTVETYEKIYAPIIKEAVESLEKKGYVSKDMLIIDEVANDCNLTTYKVSYLDQKYSDVHYNNLCHLLGRKVMKIFCREFVKGTTFAVELYPTTSK
jgi:hypothetical protein